MHSTVHALCCSKTSKKSKKKRKKDKKDSDVTLSMNDRWGMYGTINENDKYAKAGSTHECHTKHTYTLDTSKKRMHDHAHAPCIAHAAEYYSWLMEVKRISRETMSQVGTHACTVRCKGGPRGKTQGAGCIHYHFVHRGTKGSTSKSTLKITTQVRGVKRRGRGVEK